MGTIFRTGPASAVAMILVFAAWGQWATAQTFDFGPKVTNVDGGAISIVFGSLPREGHGDTSLNVTFFGDLGGPQGHLEYLDVLVDGTNVGRLFGTNQCGSAVKETILIPTAVMQAAAADGTVEILFDASADVGAFCSVPSQFAGSEDSGFGVMGTLNVTASVPAFSAALGPSAELLVNRLALVAGNTSNTTNRIQRLQTGSGQINGGLAFAGIPLMADLTAEIAVAENEARMRTGANLGATMLWAEAAMVRFADANVEDGRFSVLHFGADWKVHPDLVVGIVAQIDSIHQTNSVSGISFSGTGFMVGPSMTHRLADDLYVTGILGIGMAQNDITQSGFSDQFDSRRVQIDFSLIGETEMGAYTVAPEFQVLYLRESAEAYISAVSGPLPEGTATFTQARLGGRIARDLDQNDTETLTLYSEFFAAYSDIGEGVVSDATFGQAITGLSGELGFGLSYLNRSGATFDMRLSTAGLFTDADQYAVQLNLHIPLR